MCIADIAWASVVPQLLFVLVYVAGLIVAVVLLVRHRSTAAILTVIAFAVPFLMSLASLARGPLTVALSGQGSPNARMWATAGVGCCSSGADVAAPAPGSSAHRRPWRQMRRHRR